MLMLMSLANKITCRGFAFVYLVTNQLANFYFYLLANKHDLKALSRLAKTHYSTTMHYSFTDHILFLCLPNVPLPDRQIGGKLGEQSVMGVRKTLYSLVARITLT